MYDASKHLPLYASDHELRVSSVSFLMDDIEAAIIALSKEKNPAECRAEILPWLAYEASADFWDPAWFEDTRRTVIAAQWEIHRHKGTPYALNYALDMVGLESNLVEWWQMEPPGVPGTFEVTAWLAKPVYDREIDHIERLTSIAHQAITRTKPLSRHYSLRLALRSWLSIVPHSALQDLQKVKILPPMATDLSSTMKMVMAGCASTGELVRIKPKQTTAIYDAMSLAFGGSTSVGEVIRLYPPTASGLESQASYHLAIGVRPANPIVTILPEGHA
ncbi:phage tail protein, P2 protein I family [Cohaesibacter sp. ES.047]|uniref:phage tail protein I n=1 Tax=Cohaesibacter sp. ES.047 TaxID=1798205 RepID=UPI000BB693C6|nr:phage tail protein I [Cohaesibacter sp. ES.047]SNY91398.1 phage tail protein, P2 protein I family [Cohaesibacter sp. ES.047]